MSELKTQLEKQFASSIERCTEAFGEVTIEVSVKNYKTLCQGLKEHPDFQFEQLMDLCGVDYSSYGESEWATDSTSTSGFSRGVEQGEDIQQVKAWEQSRYAVVVHLLSLKYNRRLRLRTFAEAEPPVVDSVNDIWAAANWFEREAFDLFGILFDGHPDLRRILTDYGFIGHPFRKDFPLSGNVEMRYDAKQGRVIYEPVNIKPRTLVPRVIREDSRYVEANETPKEVENG